MKKGAKRSKHRKKVNKGGSKRYDVKNIFAFKLLVGLLILLFFLVIIWILVYEPVIKEEEKEGFGLGTLSWGVEAENINLNVIDFQLLNDNQTISVEVRRDAGVGDIGEIIFIFNRSEGVCNYTEGYSFPTELSTRTYLINSVDTDCGPSNFTNIVNASNITLIVGVNVYKEPFFPEDCGAGNMTAMWESIFTEPSTGLNVISDVNYGGVANRCGHFFVYKLNGNIVYLLYGRNYNYTNDEHIESEIYVLRANVNDSVLAQIGGLSEPTDIYEGLQIIEGLRLSGAQIGEREIITENDAIEIFERTFFSQVYQMSSSVKPYAGVDKIYYRNYISGGWVPSSEGWEDYEFSSVEVYKNEVDFFNYGHQIAKRGNLTLVKNFEDIIVYKDEGNVTSRIYLEEYFSCLIDGFRAYVFSGDLGPSNISQINNYSAEGGIESVIFGIPGGDYGTQAFAVEANCGYLDSISKYHAGFETALTFNVTFLNQNRPPINQAPDFNRTICDDLVWEVNTDYSLNMTKCWSDEDGDSLSLRYQNRSDDHLTISQSGVVLTLDPDTNWVGSAYFYIYANDGEDEEGGRVDFIVRNSTVVNYTNASAGTNGTTPIAIVPKIGSSSPSGTIISLFPDENKTFSITAGNYTTIKWYLDGVLKKEGGLSFDFGGLDTGTHVIKVDVINGTRIDSKVWNLNIEEDEVGKTRVLNVGKVIFYLIVVVLIMIILLTVWLILSERKRSSKKINMGFGVSLNQGGNRPGNRQIKKGRPVGKRTPLKQFNIPGKGP